MACVLDEDQDLQFFTHKIIVPKRNETVPNCVKNIRTTAVVRGFDKDASVFADWVRDDKDTALKCINHDLELWHGDKFIKDAEDLVNTENVMRSYAKEIKDIFI